MSLREEMWKYEQITGESAEHVPIIKLGAFLDGYEMGIKALEQQPCEDCISREAVEKITWEEPSYDDALNVLTEVRDKVRALPSVTPSRPRGKWIHWTDDYKDYVTCPSCGYGEEGEVLLADKTPFCPICGEDLRGEPK